MLTIRIEHKISGYDAWKQAFDNDPINRKKSGVKQYRIFRPEDDDNYVAIDLDFDDPGQAKATQGALNKMFGNLEGNLIFGAKVKVLSLVETASL
jgi:hypothetical protein